MKVKALKKTTGDCPVQFEGTLEDGRMVYARYRDGLMSVSISAEATKNIYDAVRGKSLFYERVGEQFDGYMEDSVFFGYLKKAGLDLEDFNSKFLNKEDNENIN